MSGAATNMTGRAWRFAGGALTLDVPRVLAIVNVTPDSFSDGGEAFTPERALERIELALRDGADAIDIGGESTRPGAARVPEDEQIARVIPVIRAARHAGVNLPISIDTTRARVARAAIDEGANIINDVSAGLEDPEILPLAASAGCGLILMHRAAPPPKDVYSHQYANAPHYDPGSGGVVGVVRAFLLERARAALALGVQREAIVLDPGLGFGKGVEQNYELIRRAAELQSLGFAALSAASRKSFLGAASGEPDPKSRVAASVAVTVFHALAGLRLFRVHDVAAHVQALRAVRAIMGDPSPRNP